MVILPKAVYTLNLIPIKMPMTFIIETEKIQPKVHLEIQKTMNSQSNTQQRRGMLGVSQYTTSNYTIEDLDINPHSYAHLTFDKGTKNIQWRKDSLFNKCFWEKWLCACRKLKLDPCLSPVLVSTQSR
jgi:hypothetical protein